RSASPTANWPSATTTPRDRRPGERRNPPLLRRFASARAQEDEGVARLGVGGPGECYRDQRAVGIDPEQQVGGLGDRAIGGLGGDAGAGGVAGGQGRVGEGGGEEGFAGGVGGHHA